MNKNYKLLKVRYLALIIVFFVLVIFLVLKRTFSVNIPDAKFDDLNFYNLNK